MPNTIINKTIDILVQATTRNQKTGNIPTIIVGQNQNDVVKSCMQSGCKLLHTKLGGKGEYKELGLKPCYAHNSSVSWATKSIFRALDKGTKALDDYSLTEGFRMSARTAKYFRCSSIGDISSISHKRFNEILKEGIKYGLKPLGYTADKTATHLKESLLLSCPTIEETDQAVNEGWRATTIFQSWNGKKTFTTPSGHKGIVCPEQTQSKSGKEITPRNKITCNDCGLCSQGNQHTTKYKVIGFITH
jgi:hypothetical protein